MKSEKQVQDYINISTVPLTAPRKGWQFVVECLGCNRFCEMRFNSRKKLSFASVEKTAGALFFLCKRLEKVEVVQNLLQGGLTNPTSLASEVRKWDS